jgi:pyridoxal 5'-phosphate synthase pdxT subunit
MMPLPVGLLALQGDYDRHRLVLDRLGLPSLQVRYPADLQQVGGLVLPGGESTTLSRLLDSSGLRGPLLEFAAAGKPILGTCAGLIMLANRLTGEKRADGHGVRPLGLLDVAVQRNGYGRQIDSFTEPLSLAGDLAGDLACDAVYIRAPRIVDVGPTVEVIARRPDGEIVGVRQGSIVGLSFHPELGSDTRFHQLLA